jgi:hypothetical protein
MSLRSSLTAGVAATFVTASVLWASPNVAAFASTPFHPFNCAQSRSLCTEVADSEQAFGEGNYIGHDEPSVLWYSSTPGSGNRMRYGFTLPKDPPPQPVIGQRSYNFQLTIADWFGMAMCDTESYPETVKSCTPDSDANIASPTDPHHVGTAFMELQFYPPGWAPWPAGVSCSAKQWCGALTIDSLSENPVTGQLNNASCLNSVGVEPVNFAFLTHNGKSQAPANPVDATASTYTPDPAKDLFMKSGDQLSITMHDTAQGLTALVVDQSSGEAGSMTASKANGFGQVIFDPSGSTCRVRPYDFHPMYSTSSPQTRVPWAAHTYNVAFDAEIGHFDYCSKVPTTLGSCAGMEGGFTTGRHPSDRDDNVCFPSAASLLVRVSGCIDSNEGFDGTSYVRDWPDGNTNLHPSPTLFTSPLTGSSYNIDYQRVAFETDTPRIEDGSIADNCDRFTGKGCVLIPITDDGVPATFYPWFTSGTDNGRCTWTIGQNVPGFTTNDYGKVHEFGQLLKVNYIDSPRWNDFRNILPDNPCPARR